MRAFLYDVRRFLRRKRFRWLLCICLAALIGGVGDYWLYPVFASPSAPAIDRGSNGLWLRYKWYFGEHSVDDVHALAQRTRQYGIKDAYFHVRSIQPDGTLKYRYLAKAQALNRALRELAPELRRIAWIYAGNPHGLGEVDLGNSKVRKRMAEEAEWLVRKAGFDGVQWDYEICSDNDPNLLRLLEETRRVLPAGSFLGVAVPTWFPPPISGFGWSESYFGEVARRCDQLAVMSYDTAAYTPRLYSWLVAQQVVRVTKAVAKANPECRVTIGVPTYGDGTASHNPHAENLKIALLGVRDGLASGADLRVWQGVSLFADYTTDDSEWKTFEGLWQRK